MILGASLSFQSYVLDEGIHRNPDVCMQISLSEEIKDLFSIFRSDPILLSWHICLERLQSA